MKGLISVVVPVYKVEPYLVRCVDSILGQTYSNLEVILVDDGSPDGCGILCDAYAEKDPRVRVVHKENAGLGMARNTGIENATGEYICFFDSDDYIALDTIEKAYQLARAEQSEIVLFGFHKVSSAGEVINSIIPQTDKVTCAGPEVQSDFLPDLIAAKSGSHRKNLHMSACACLYSMELISRAHWRFASEREIISEDVFSLMCLYKDVRRVSVLSQALYFYCENGQSLTHVYRRDRYEKICHFHQASVNKARELGFSQEVIYRLQEQFLSFTIAAMKMIARADCPESEKRQEIRVILNGDYLRKFQWDPNGNAEASPQRKLFVAMLKRRVFWGCYLLLKLA